MTPTRALPTAVTLLLAAALTAGACATPAPVAHDPAWDDARACLAVVTWIDRVEGDRAVAVAPSGASRAIPIALMPAGASEGAALVGGAPDGRCQAHIRAYVRALRALNASAGDTSEVLRLE